MVNLSSPVSEICSLRVLSRASPRHFFAFAERVKLILRTYVCYMRVNILYIITILSAQTNQGSVALFFVISLVVSFFLLLAGVAGYYIAQVFLDL